jgi:hypothetical protein
MSIDLWGPTDVKAGIAVFYSPTGPQFIPNEPYFTELPAPAILREGGAGEPTPVILIQAEQGPNGVIVGYRHLGGGNGLCTLEELEILPNRDSRFTAA